MDVRSSPERKALSTLSNSNTQGIPVSPTANLKLLTNVASELGGTLQKRQSLITPNSQKVRDSKTRKDKSLGILCDKFLAMFPLNLPDGCELLEICLDRVSQQLGIVKRRIYDIINILESLQMASKVAKNRYYWHGCQNLELTLAQLKAIGLKCGIDVKLQSIQAQQRGGFRLVSGPACCHFRRSPVVCSSPVVTDHEYLKTEKTSFSKDDFFCDERTLGVLCQKFIMLFLVSPQCEGVVNLDLATRMLVSEAAESETEREMWGNFLQCHKAEGDEDCGRGTKDCRCLLRLKTKVRRLYDIANVLTSLGLIAKMENPPNSMRKPVFYYTGPVVEAASSFHGISSSNIRQSLLSSFYDDDVGMENKEKFMPYKRKINFKNGPAEKMPRTSSDNALDQRKSSTSIVNHQQCSMHHGDSGSSFTSAKCLKFKSSLLQVAEQEFQRLRSSEESTASEGTLSARKKLSFSRCHSDSCIQSQYSHDYDVTDCEREQSQKLVPESNASKVVLPFSSSVHKSICITIGDIKNKRFTITRKLVEVPMHMLPQKRSEGLSFKVPRAQFQSLDAVVSSPSEQINNSGCSNSSVQTSSDILNNNTIKFPALNSTEESIIRDSSKAGSKFVPSFSSGDLYRAVRVGNVVRLVPLHTYLKVGNSKEAK